MEIRGMMGGLYRFCEWIFRFSVTNVLWMFCSLPFFFFVLVLLMSQDLSQLVTTLLIMGVVAPFTLFPATTAMFSLARKWVMGDEDAPILRTFFGSYKENYKQSMLGGMIIVLLLIILSVNYQFYVAQDSVFQFLSVLFIAFMIIVIVATFNFFSILVHLHMKTLQLIKNAILITLGRPLNSLMLILSNGLVFYLSFFKFTFLIPFFMGSIIAYLTFLQFHRVFTLIQKKREEYEAEMRESAEKELVEKRKTEVIQQGEDS